MDLAGGESSYAEHIKEGVDGVECSSPVVAGENDQAAVRLGAAPDLESAADDILGFGKVQRGGEAGDLTV